MKWPRRIVVKHQLKEQTQLAKIEKVAQLRQVSCIPEVTIFREAMRVSNISGGLLYLGIPPDKTLDKSTDQA